MDTSSPLTPEERQEVDTLYRGNEGLAREIAKLVADMTKEKEARRVKMLEENVEIHQSAAYLKEIRSLKSDAPLLPLIEQWRDARKRCASFSETIEEIEVSMVEIKKLCGRLSDGKAA